MVVARDLDNHLRDIKSKIKEAIGAHGNVEHDIIDAQATALKGWILDFESYYVEAAKNSPTKHTNIATGGRTLSHQAWFVYEVLIEAEMRSAEGEPHVAHWHYQPGTVPAEVKAQALEEITKLYTDFINFKEMVVGD